MQSITHEQACADRKAKRVTRASCIAGASGHTTCNGQPRSPRRLALTWLCGQLEGNHGTCELCSCLIFGIRARTGRPQVAREQRSAARVFHDVTLCNCSLSPRRD